ncbi:MAG: FtsX-like permease family protein [Rhodobacteraceae bacterium]|nr:FtsX-like permease family protein [Paracoccaceae bacterium]
MIWTGLQVLLSHWRANLVQLAGLLAGLALATGLWSAVQAINAQARANYAEAADQLTGGQFDRLTHPDRDLTVADFAALRRAGWAVAPVLEGRATLGATRVAVLGVDFVSYPPLPALEDLEEGTTPIEILITPGRGFARPELVARLTDVPDLPPLISTDQVPPGTLLVDISWAETLLDRAGLLSHMILLPNAEPGAQPLSEVISGLQRDGASQDTDITRLTDSFHLNLTAFGLLSFAVGLFIAHGSVGLAFEQRRPVIRTLRALGLPTRRLAALVLAELCLLALVAGLIGLVLGYVVAGALLPEVAVTLRGLYGAPVDGGLELRTSWVLAGLGMALLGTGLASVQALWRIAAMPLLDSATSQTWMRQSREGNTLRLLTGLALVLAGVLASLTIPGLIAGFALLAGLLMGAAVALPPVLGWLIDLGSRFGKGPLGEWLWADMRAQLPGLSLALAALLLALAANIGVGTMVSSFRLTFLGWLDQRLASELYLRAENDAQGRDMAMWLEERVDAVLPIRSAPLDDLMGAPGRVFGVADHPTYRDHWPLIDSTENAWDSLASGEAVLINEQLARRHDIWPGQSVQLDRGWEMPVVGVYSDYGNPSGQVMMGLDHFDARFPTVPHVSFALRVDPSQADALAQEISARFDLPVGAVVNQVEVKQTSLSVFETTFVITGALNILTLGVAGIAMLTALLTLRDMRLPHLAPLWALGLTRAELARYESQRSVALAALTALLALPLGLVLAWALLNVINVKAFGWLLPMHLFPSDWLTLFALALATGWLAAALPARRLRRTPPADLLRVFAHDR